MSTDKQGNSPDEDAFASGEDPEELEGVDTLEGDVENRATRSGAAAEDKLGRTNK